MHSQASNVVPGAKGWGRDTSVRHQLAVLAPLLGIDGVTELVVNEPGVAWVEVNGQWDRHEVAGLTLDALRQMGTAVASYAKNDWSESRPILSAVLPDMERSQWAQAPAVDPGVISLTIRKPSKELRTLESYEKSGFFDHVRAADAGLPDDELRIRELYAKRDFGAFLRQAVVMEKNIIIAGETGSGKTTLMKALMQEIPTHERIVTIEDVPELFLPNHPNHVHLFYPSEGGSDAVVTSQSLLRSCMRMKPSRILLAELRGPETLDFVQVCASGHGGSITSLHAGSAKLALARMAMLIQERPGTDIPHDVIKQNVHMVVDVIVHVRNEPGRGRHITEVWYKPITQPEP